jgi:hypothetical protein
MKDILKYCISSRAPRVPSTSSVCFVLFVCFLLFLVRLRDEQIAHSLFSIRTVFLLYSKTCTIGHALSEKILLSFLQAARAQFVQELGHRWPRKSTRCHHRMYLASIHHTLLQFVEGRQVYGKGMVYPPPQLLFDNYDVTKNRVQLLS